MATITWIGGTATWDATTTAVWDTGTVPTAADDVVFSSATTYTVTLSGTLNCKSFTVSAGTVNFTGTASPTLGIYGSYSVVAGTTFASTSMSFIFAATTTGNTITTNGTVLVGYVIFNGVGGGWTLNDNFTLDTIVYYLTFSNGSLNLNGKTVTCWQLTCNSSTTGGMTLIWGGAGVYIVGFGSAFSSALSVTDRVTNTGTPSLYFTYSGVSARTINMGAYSQGNGFNYFITAGGGGVTHAGFGANNVDYTGTYSGSVVWATGAGLRGNLTYNSTMSLLAAAAPMVFAGTSVTQLVYFAGRTFDKGFQVGDAVGNSPTVKLMDTGATIGTTATRGIVLVNGTLDLNGQTIKTAIGSTSAGTKNITFNGGTLNFNGGGSNFWQNTNPTGFTTTAGTGTGYITVADVAAATRTFAGGGSTYNCVLKSSNTLALIITGANTFQAIQNAVSPAAFTFPAATTTTVSSAAGWQLLGTAGNLVTIDSSTAASAATISVATGYVSSDYISFKDSAGSGGATFYAGVNSTNVSGNSGWLFSTAPFVPTSNLLVMF